MVTRSRLTDGSENLSFRLAFASICATGLLLLALPARAQRPVLQTRSAAPPKARLVGKLPTTQELSLALTLPLRNEAQFLIQQLYDPSSPEHRHFLTAQQFTNQFGPPAADYDEVIRMRWCSRQRSSATKVRFAAANHASYEHRL